MSVDQGLVAAVSSQLPGVTDEHVAMVLTALDVVRNGSLVGTIVQNPDTGAIALRVREAGIDMWRITGADGSTWGDMAPTLPGWVVLKEGTASE